MSNARIILLYVVYILLIGGITIGIIFSVRSIGHDKKTAKQTSQSQTQVSPATPKADTSKPPQPPDTSKSGTSAQIKKPAPAAKPSTSAAGSIAGRSGNVASTQLANTGPGDVVALFLLATGLGIFAHRRYIAKA